MFFVRKTWTLGECNLLIVYEFNIFFLTVVDIQVDEIFYRARMIATYAYVHRRKSSVFELKRFCIWELPDLVCWEVDRCPFMASGHCSLFLLYLVAVTLPQTSLFSSILFTVPALQGSLAFSPLPPSVPSPLLYRT